MTFININQKNINKRKSDYYLYSVYIIALFLFPTVLANNHPERQKLIFRSTGVYPLNSERGQKGFLDELMRLILEENNLSFQSNVYPSARSLRYLNSGVIDGDMCRIGGLQITYNNIIQVPEKVLEIEFSLFSIKNIDTRFGWKSIKGMNVGYIRGWEIIDKNLPAGTRSIKAQSFQQLINLLERHRIDAIIYGNYRGEYMLSKLKKSNIHIQSPPLAKEDMYIYLNIRHKDMIPMINNALIEMKKNGAYRDLYHKYLSSYEHEN